MSFYAKPLDSFEGTYEYHVGKCLEIVSDYLNRHRAVLEKLCPEWNMSFDDFSMICLRAAFFHDFGKLGDIFQQNMRYLLENKDEKERRWRMRYFRHELLSARLLYELSQDGVFPYDVWAVLGHHKRLNVGWDSFAREKNDPEPERLDAQKIEFGLHFDKKWVKLLPSDEDTIKKLFRTKLFSPAQDDDEDEDNWVSEFLDNFSEQYLTGTNEKVTYKLNRFLAALTRGILGYADWQASAEADKRMNIYQPLDNVLLDAKIRDNIKRKRNGIYQKRPFQSACEDTQGNILAIAPTGSGKTEASLLWATNNGAGKILFLMPTKVTSNSIYERMADYFAPRDCGLSHSGAGVYFALKGDNDDNIQDDVKNEQLRALRQYKAFMAPVMVATVDQLLTANFNIGDWFFKELATLGASVIFDEIHAYDTYTLALITESIRRIKKLGGRVMVMSATMPDNLRKHFQTILEVDAPVVAEELMDRRKCFWEYCDEPLEAYDDDILRALKQDRKVAIVVNTVKEAQRIFLRWRDILSEEMPDKKIMCYHSNFIMGDRRKKEKKLLERDDKKRPAVVDLLVATQVIEVSLDISFDIMFSECAPMDSLIQRAGRCNRFIDLPDSRFIVFPISNVAKKYVYSDVGAVLQRTEEVLHEYSGNLSERELSDILEKIYHDFDLYDKAYNDGKNIVNYLLNNDTQIMDTVFGDGEEAAEKLTTRKQKVVKIPVIPIKFRGEIESLLESSDSASFYKIAEYEVPIVANRKFPINIIKKRVGFLYICEIDYDEETGVKYDFDASEFI